MHWPDIFFKVRKPSFDAKLSPAPQAAPERPKLASAEPHPPAIKPLPVALGAQASPFSTPVPVSIKAAPEEAETRTLPAMHGIVLRPPVWPSIPTKESPDAPASAESTGPARPSAPVKDVEELMAEADPVRTLSQTGGVRMLKRLAPGTDAPNSAAKKPAEPTPVKAEPSAPNGAAKPTAEPTPVKAESSPSSTVSAPAKAASAPVAAPAVAAKPLPPAAPPAVDPPAPRPRSFGSIFHRKAKMTELARIVLPPKREEPEPTPTLPESSPTVVPPSFPVADAAHGTPAEGVNAHGSKPEISLSSVASRKGPDEAKPPRPEASAPAPESAPASTPVAEAKPLAAPLPDSPAVPKVDPGAHKAEPSATPLPKVDPQAHQAAPTPAPVAAPTSTQLSAPSAVPEKREFHLANGERVAGVVLSETPEAVYIEHGTLGVLTIPRAQIARKLVEIILINGDRIVGDIMAETADTLYVRHASLGMLTVPRAQRSTRVVEAILKDGDRILGEVLTETDSFTVIRSATLGTVTVPHGKMSMLNRKIEQIQLKALPPPAPELKDKAAR
jgi:RNase P/RNase MRP subunit p29